MLGGPGTESATTSKTEEVVEAQKRLLAAIKCRDYDAYWYVVCEHSADTIFLTHILLLLLTFNTNVHAFMHAFFLCLQ